MAHRLPSDGGCWYCHDDGGNGWLASIEFDCVLHADCLLREIHCYNRRAGDDGFRFGRARDLEIFCREFSDYLKEQGISQPCFD